MDDQYQQNRHRWGVSQYYYVAIDVAVAIAYGKAGGASSEHYHAHKHNAFIVISGEIEIVWAARARRLGPLDAYVVPAGKPHRMKFVTDAVLYEFYIAVPGHPIELGDIIRLDNGWEPGQ